MAIGPVQLIVLGFNHPNFHGEIIDELERLRESDTMRVIDALAVHKDADGEIEVAHLSNLTKDEAIELGSKVGALIGLGIEGEEGMDAGAAAGAEAAADGVSVFNDQEAWDVLEDIPNDSAAALILLEHHWAVPLRDAIARAGGFRLSDGFISPLDLVEIGLIQPRRQGTARHGDQPPDRLRPCPPVTRRLEQRCSDPAGSPGAPRGASLAAARSRRARAPAGHLPAGALDVSPSTPGIAAAASAAQATTGTDLEGALGWNGRMSSWSRPTMAQVASGTSFQTPATSPSGSDTISRASSESSWSSCLSG